MILVIFFIIIGIAGLIFRVDAGVFIGFSLFPYQYTRMSINEKVNNIMIGIGSIIGTVYFIWTRNWILVVLFLFSQALTYTASQHLMKDGNNNKDT